jgi:CHAT domain-containing protein/predicted negative regulator of RcsB-dependent stress response
MHFSTLILALLLLARPGSAARELKPGLALTGSIQRGSSDLYVLNLGANTSAVIQLDQGGIDLAITVTPSVGTSFEVNARESGPEPVLIYAVTAGRYGVEVRQTGASASLARYQITEVAERALVPDDIVRMEAQVAASDARRLVLEGGEPKLRAALEQNGAARELWRKLGDRAAEASTLIQMGSIHYLLGETGQAPALCLGGIEAARDAGSQWLEGEGLNNLALAEWRLGAFPDAETHLSEARTIWKGLGHRYGEAAALSNLGILYRETGSYAEAVKSYQDALPILVALGDKDHEAIVRSNLGVVLHALADDRRALISLDRAIALLRQIGNRSGEGRATLHVGAIQLAAGHRLQAMIYAQKALVAAQDSRDTRTEADSWNLLGDVQAAEGRNDSALTSFETALQSYVVLANRAGRADSLHRIGVVEAKLGRRPMAAEHFKQVIEARHELGIRDGEAETLFQLASVEQQSGNLRDSSEHIEAALDLADSLRVLASGATARMTYLASKQQYFAFAISLYVEMDLRSPRRGFAARALEIAERARARALLDQIDQGPVARLGSSEDRARQRRVLAELNFWSTRLSNLAQQSGSADLPAVNQRVAELLDEYQDIQTSLHAADGFTLSVPRTLTAAEIQGQVLDSDTVLLEFALAGRQSVLWAVTRQSVNAYRLPGRAAIERAAQAFYRLTSDAPVATKEPLTTDVARKFSTMLIGPVATTIKGKRLIIVAEDFLLRTPFAALPDPISKTPLALQHEIVSVPSASVLAEIRQRIKKRKQPPNNVAVVADPVLDAGDQRNKIPARGTRPAFARLSNTRAEAESLLALSQGGHNLRAVDFDANRTLFMSGQLASYRVIHIATHAVAEPSRPELSQLVLSLVDSNGHPRNGLLHAYDIAQLNLPADLITLAACRTGLGAEIQGEGTVGLAHAFLQSGAASILVSLWDVDDRSSAELMRLFYDSLLKDRLRPAAALRQAQISMMREGRWTQADWGAWAVIGEWR